MRHLGIGLSFVALLAVAGATAGRTRTVCTVAYVPYFHSDDMTYLLATALDTTVTDRTDSVAVSSTRRALLPIHSRGTVEGQLLRVQAARGVGADSISRRLAAGDSVAVLIRWGLGSDCSTIPVGPGIPAGEVNHFIVALRPSAAWVQGHPTFEVGPSSYFGIYPGSLRSQQGPNVSFLSPVEFSSFVDALPTDTAWQTDCRGAMTRLKRWTNDHRALSAKYPVPDALRDLGGVCDKRRS